jgi:hypothetical protein
MNGSRINLNTSLFIDSNDQSTYFNDYIAIENVCLNNLENIKNIKLISTTCGTELLDRDVNMENSIKLDFINDNDCFLLSFTPYCDNYILVNGNSNNLEISFTPLYINDMFKIYEEEIISFPYHTFLTNNKIIYFRGMINSINYNEKFDFEIKETILPEKNYDESMYDAYLTYAKYETDKNDNVEKYSWNEIIMNIPDHMFGKKPEFDDQSPFLKITIFKKYKDEVNEILKITNFSHIGKLINI